MRNYIEEILLEYSIFHISRSRFYGKQGKALHEIKKNNGVSRVYNILEFNDYLYTTRKNRETFLTLQQTPDSRASNYRRNGKRVGSINFNLSSNVISSITLLINADVKDKDSAAEKFLQRLTTECPKDLTWLMKLGIQT